MHIAADIQINTSIWIDISLYFQEEKAGMIMALSRVKQSH